MNSAVAILLVTSAFGGLMVIGIQLRKCGWKPEATRKLLHVGMGLVSLSFPFLFTKVIPVVVLCAGFIAVLLALRTIPSLHVANAVMGGVGRSSFGEIYFALSVVLLFVLSKGNYLEYAVPLAILTFADAASALVGVRLGRHRYRGADGNKSWEGSATFVIVAFACAWAPLWFVESISGGQSFLIAACIALLTMLIEASAWRGLDNLFLPLATIAMLRTFVDQPSASLVHRLGVLLGLVGVFFCCRKRVLLHEGVCLGALVIAYLGWAYGGWVWLIAPLTILIVPGLLTRCKQVKENHHALLSIGIPPTIWLLGASIMERREWISSYSAAYASQFAMSLVAVWSDPSGRHSRSLLVAGIAATAAWSMLLAPLILMEQFRPAPDLTLIASLPLLVGIAVSFVVFKGIYLKASRPEVYWLGRSLLSFAGSLAISRS